MKIEFSRLAILRALICAASATPNRTPKDILKNVLLTGSGKFVEVIGTDQEIGIRAQVDESGVITTIKERFDVLLQPQRVRSILQELKDDFVVFDIEDHSLRIIGTGARFKVATEDAREFPPVPELKSDDVFVVGAKPMAAGIRRTEFACDLESTRYALGGISVEITNDTCILAATDSRRLSVVNIACEKSGTPKAIEKSTVIPVKAWRAIASATENAENVRFQVGDNDATFRIGNVTVYSRLVEGRFPRYRDVIPRQATVRVSLPVTPLFSALRQAQIVLDKESRAVSMKLSDGTLSVKSQSTAGESSVQFPCEYDKDDMAVSLDAVYVCDLLKTLPHESLVEMSLVDADTAVVFRVDGVVTYVVMPLNPT